MHQHGLGRVPSPIDPGDKLFPMRALLAPAPPARQYRYWTPGAILDQGQTPHCVGFAWAQWMETSPLRGFVGNEMGDYIYAACKQIDGSPNEDGTYVRAGAKVLDGEGRILEYRWAETLADLTDWLLTRGPVVVGTDWLSDMFDPASNGHLSVTGEVEGGHAYLLRGYNRKTRLFRMVNSWSEEWGQRGQAWIDQDDMWALISRGGEAVAAVEKRP